MDNETKKQAVSNPLKHVVMCSFTKDELKMLLNGTHDRAHHLLSLSDDMSQAGFHGPRGDVPTIDDIRSVKKGSDDYFELVKKVRNYRNT